MSQELIKQTKEKLDEIIKFINENKDNYPEDVDLGIILFTAFPREGIDNKLSLNGLLIGKEHVVISLLSKISQDLN